MHQALNAYARMSETALSPRELEAAVLLKAAARLQAIGDEWDARRSDLGEALAYNRKLWTILAASATAEDNPLPPEAKQGIAKLAAFIFRRTLAVLAEPEARLLAALVSINREVAAGLRTPVRAAA